MSFNSGLVGHRKCCPCHQLQMKLKKTKMETYEASSNGSEKEMTTLRKRLNQSQFGNHQMPKKCGYIAMKDKFEDHLKRHSTNTQFGMVFYLLSFHHFSLFLSISAIHHIYSNAASAIYPPNAYFVALYNLPHASKHPSYLNLYILEIPYTTIRFTK